MSTRYLPAIFVLFFAAASVRADQPTTRPHVKVTWSDAKLPSSPGYFVLRATAQVGDKSIPFRVGLFLPPGYFKTHDPFPLVVALHNRGFMGDNGEITQEGMTSLWVRDHDDRNPTTLPAGSKFSVRKQARFVGVAPQCPAGMAFESPPMPQIVGALADTVADTFRVDADREYLTGFSYGATSTFRIAEQMPDQFAAIAPISSRDTDNPKATIDRLIHVPVYLASGTDEWATSTCKIMADALKSQGHPEYIYRLIQGGNHYCYPSVYQDPKFWDWLFSHRRSARPTKRASTRPAIDVAASHAAGERN